MTINGMLRVLSGGWGSSFTVVTGLVLRFHFYPGSVSVCGQWRRAKSDWTLVHLQRSGGGVVVYSRGPPLPT